MLAPLRPSLAPPYRLLTPRSSHCLPRMKRSCSPSNCISYISGVRHSEPCRLRISVCAALSKSSTRTSIFPQTLFLLALAAVDVSLSASFCDEIDGQRWNFVEEIDEVGILPAQLVFALHFVDQQAFRSTIAFWCACVVDSGCGEQILLSIDSVKIG